MFNAKCKKKRRSVFSKTYISETMVHLQMSRDTCLMYFDKVSFYHGPIAIGIS